MNAAINMKVPAREGRDENRLRTGGACLIDIARHVCAEGWEIGLAIESLAGDVVMTELNKDVRRMPCQRLRPMSLGSVTLRAPSAECEVEQRCALVDGTFESSPPAAFLRHRGIAYESDADR